MREDKIQFIIAAGTSVLAFIAIIGLFLAVTELIGREMITKPLAWIIIIFTLAGIFALIMRLKKWVRI